MSNHILAIGIDNYPNCNKLNNAANDIKKLVSTFTTSYNFQDKHVKLLINEVATMENIINEFEGYLSKLTSKDNLLILFAGHGDYDPGLELGYILPFEAKPFSKASFIPYSTLFNYIRAFVSHHTLLISDSCYAGSLFNPVRAVETSLDRLDKIPSKWAITSGRNEPVSDGVPGQNSPFAQSLVKILSENRKSQIGISELSNKVIAEIASLGGQIPRGEPLQSYGHKGGEFVLRKNTINKEKSSSNKTAKINETLGKLVLDFWELEKIIESAENDNKTGTIRRLETEQDSLKKLLDKELIKELEIQQNSLLKSAEIRSIIGVEFIELNKEIQKHRNAKNDAIKKQQYDKAADLRDKERKALDKIEEFSLKNPLAEKLMFTKESIYKDYSIIQIISEYSKGQSKFDQKLFLENSFGQILFHDLSFDKGLISQYVYKDKRQQIIDEIKNNLSYSL